MVVSCQRSCVRAGAELGVRPAGNVPMESSPRPLMGGPQLCVVEIVLSSCWAETRADTHTQALAGSAGAWEEPPGGKAAGPSQEVSEGSSQDRRAATPGCTAQESGPLQ